MHYTRHCLYVYCLSSHYSLQSLSLRIVSLVIGSLVIVFTHCLSRHYSLVIVSTHCLSGHCLSSHALPVLSQCIVHVIVSLVTLSSFSCVSVSSHSARPYESCKIFKGRPRRNVFSKLVHRQYKSFPPDRFCQVEIQNTTGLSNKSSTA